MANVGHQHCGFTLPGSIWTLPPLSCVPSSAWPSASFLLSAPSPPAPHGSRRGLSDIPLMLSLPTQKPPVAPHCQLLSLAQEAFIGGQTQPCLTRLLSLPWAVYFRHARTLT